MAYVKKAVIRRLANCVHDEQNCCKAQPEGEVLCTFKRMVLVFAATRSKAEQPDRSEAYRKKKKHTTKIHISTATFGVLA